MKNLIAITSILLVSSPAMAQEASQNEKDKDSLVIEQLTVAPFILAGGSFGKTSLDAHLDKRAAEKDLAATKTGLSDLEMDAQLKAFEQAENDFVEKETKDLVLEQKSLARQNKVIKGALAAWGEEFALAQKNLAGTKKLYQNKKGVNPDSLSREEQMKDLTLKHSIEDYEIVKSKMDSINNKLSENIAQQAVMDKKVEAAKLAAIYRWRATEAGASGLKAVHDSATVLLRRAQLDFKIQEAARTRLRYGVAGAALVIGGTSWLYGSAYVKDGSVIESLGFTPKIQSQNLKDEKISDQTANPAN